MTLFSCDSGPLSAFEFITDDFKGAAPRVEPELPNATKNYSGQESFTASDDGCLGADI